MQLPDVTEFKPAGHRLAKRPLLIPLPTAGMAKWMQGVVDDAIAEIYKVDLLEDELLTPADVKKPGTAMVAVLREEARRRREEHRQFMRSADYKKTYSAAAFTDEDWLKQARLSLFRSKRALELAHLLHVRMALQHFWGDTPTRDGLIRLLQDGRCRAALSRVVRRAKADRVGTAIADLTVCGAVPPYSEVLGGKLVAMLMVGPQVVEEYRRRYGKLPSVIASSMAGRTVNRPAELVFIGPTSLYGQRPCQYDRIRVPCLPGDPSAPSLRYEYLGRTKGIGTFHFGTRTLDAFTLLQAHSQKGPQVNFVFGEGVNPRLRKIRDGLAELGLNADELLRHGSPRLVYGVQLVANLREYLLGMERQPHYLISRQNAAAFAAQTARWWAERWLVPRIQREEVLERVAGHNFVHPIRHGARVVLPPDDEKLLFKD